MDINTSTIVFEGQRAVLAVMRDISERKALEEARRRFDEAQLRNAREIEEKHRALAVSEARYRQLTEGCLDAVVVADEKGLITLFNPAAERTFGFEAAEVIGLPITALMPDGIPRPARRRVRPLPQDARPPRRGQDRRAPGPPQGRGRVPDGIVAERRRGRRASRSSSGRSATRGNASGCARCSRSPRSSPPSACCRAGVAHEINNPLAYIGNNLAVLERDLKGIMAMMAGYESAHDRLDGAAPEVMAQIRALSEDLDWPYVRDNLGRMLARTRDGVQRVANIVQNLRGLARTSAPKMEDVALADLLGSAVEMVQGRMRRKGIVLEVDAPEGLPKVHCVGSQIGQVFLNLLVNAVQALEEADRPEGGHLRVAIRQQAEFQAVELHRRRAGDRGRRPPQAVRPLLHHEAGRRGDRPRPVDLARDRHRPRRPDRGREHPGRRHALPHPPAEGGPLSFHTHSRPRRGRPMSQTPKHCLLVVDDEPDVCDSVHDLLRREFRVLKAHGAQEGYRLMQEEEVHIIMTDQRMPRITGVELLERVKTKNPHAVRMLFTGFTDLESIIAAINQGHVFQFLKKPWQPEELQAAVRQAAAEYDRLIAGADESARLREALQGLHHRVETLETEVRRLGGVTPPA